MLTQLVKEVAREQWKYPKRVCINLPNKRLQLEYFIIWVRDLFLKNYITSEGAGSGNVLYHPQLPIARYQVSFYANS